ncbi:MAG: periplasmic heavy metal sensor [Rhodospirillales bacterium]|nr:periplasmic heavy metal sensor [Rhodospirillales bacterium]
MIARAISGRPVSVALFVSLAVNLLLAGAIVTHLLRQPAQPTGDRWRIAAESLATTLPDADAGKLRAVLANQTPVLEAASADVRKAREAVRQAMRAEPFSPAALDQAMAEFSARRFEMQKRFQSVIAATAAQVSPDARAKMAEWRAAERTHR